MPSIIETPGNHPTHMSASVMLDNDPHIDGRLSDFDVEFPDRRQATIVFGPLSSCFSVWIYAYSPAALEAVAATCNRLAGEMRADRTAHQVDSKKVSGVAA